MVAITLLHSGVFAQTAAREFDLLLQGGHVIDPKNRISAVRDVAIKDGKIAAVDQKIDPARALKSVDVKGLYVTPGLVDIHVHVYPGTLKSSYAGGDFGVFPDNYTLPDCVTTVADAGSAGWRTFEDFKFRIVDQAKTRVLSFLNIVGAGMGSGRIEQNMDDMEVEPTAAMAKKYKDIIVGIKSAHFVGSEWTPYERAEAVGKIANIPVMVDFGNATTSGRTLDVLFAKYFRPGDIYTHMYGGRRGEQDPDTLGPSKAMIEGRKKGIFFDVGHGGASFGWHCAIPLMKAGFVPDSISTDLHRSSAGGGMKSMLNLMSKFLAMGMTLDDVILRSTWNPAKEIKREDLGHLSAGAVADVAVLRIQKGKFGFVDQIHTRLDGDQLLAGELTIRAGKVAWDLNGITRELWSDVPYNAPRPGDPRWDGFARPTPQTKK